MTSTDDHCEVETSSVSSSISLNATILSSILWLNIAEGATTLPNRAVVIQSESVDILFVDHVFDVHEFARSGIHIAVFPSNVSGAGLTVDCESPIHSNLDIRGTNDETAVN